jgi:hypothetical protein
MSPKLKPIDEQVVVITGASSGIGLEWLASKQAGSFKGKEPPRNPDGVLFRPSESAGDSGRIHGEGAMA